MPQQCSSYLLGYMALSVRIFALTNSSLFYHKGYRMLLIIVSLICLCYPPLIVATNVSNGKTNLESHGSRKITSPETYESLKAKLPLSFFMGSLIGSSIGGVSGCFHRHFQAPMFWIISWLITGDIISRAHHGVKREAQHYKVPYKKSIATTISYITFFMAWSYAMGYLSLRCFPFLD